MTIFVSPSAGRQVMDSNIIIVVYYLASRKRNQHLAANFKRSHMANHV